MSTCMIEVLLPLADRQADSRALNSRGSVNGTRGSCPVAHGFAYCTSSGLRDIRKAVSVFSVSSPPVHVSTRIMCAHVQPPMLTPQFHDPSVDKLVAAKEKQSLASRQRWRGTLAPAIRRVYTTIGQVGGTRREFQGEARVTVASGQVSFCVAPGCPTGEEAGIVPPRELRSGDPRGYQAYHGSLHVSILMNLNGWYLLVEGSDYG
ncbi:hypothetical protein V8F20_002429 [Naviculisporaceae sp. PSN 640]